MKAKATCTACGIETSDFYVHKPPKSWRRSGLPYCSRCYEDVCRREFRNEEAERAEISRKKGYAA